MEENQGGTAEVITLFRPVGPKELELIAASGYRRFPPRLPEQPIFYPVLNEAYATQIARDWNVRESGAGFVTRFQVDAAFARRYPVQTVGSSVHQELWVGAGGRIGRVQLAPRRDHRGHCTISSVADDADVAAALEVIVATRGAIVRRAL
jgi:hypothetical protein